jgi:hypothetical protein
MQVCEVTTQKPKLYLDPPLKPATSQRSLISGSCSSKAVVLN